MATKIGPKEYGHNSKFPKERTQRVSTRYTVTSYLSQLDLT